MELAKRSDAALPPWARAMNAEQLEVIEHEIGACRVLAAAGSGKTRAIVHRILRLVTLLCDPSRVLAVTFSKKAADEMNERLYALGCRGARVGTWHSLCLQIIKDDGTPWKNWRIDDTNRAKFVMKDVLGYKGMNWTGSDLTLVLGFVGICKAKLYSPDSEEALLLAKKTFGRDASRAVEAFHRYNEELAQKQLLTFDDFLVFAAQHLESSEETRLFWAGKYEFVIQDEGQDENKAQKHIARLLAKDHGNYMIVGDVYQSIYAFRGSEPEHLAKFEEEWPGAKTIWLGKNYRSGEAIINAANGIVSKAYVEGIEPRMMEAARTEIGKAHARVSEDFDGEAKNFVAWALDIVRNGGALSDVTALFRVNAQSRALEEALLGAKLPYVVVGGTSFYERKEVRDLLAYLRIAAKRGADDDIKRCINAPFRFLGNAFVDRLMAASSALKGQVHWPTLVQEVSQQAGVQSRQRASAEQWSKMIDDIETAIITRDAAIDAEGVESFPDDLAAEGKPAAILEGIVKSTRYLEWLVKEEGEESLESSSGANVREMIRVAERFSTVDALLDYIDETIKSAAKQRQDKQAGGERVLLMSVHRSKGLEWPHVWVAGCNEMILPHAKGDIEEERRLAYVAATRARDTLVLSYVRTMATRQGIKDARPSRFLLDAGVSLDAPANQEKSNQGGESDSSARALA